MLLENRIYSLSSLDFAKRPILTRLLLWGRGNNSGNSLLAIKWVMVSKFTLDGTEDCSGYMSQSLLNLSWLLLAFCSCSHFNSDNKIDHKDLEGAFWKMEVEQFKLSFSFFSSHLSILTVNNIMPGKKLRFCYLSLDFCSGALWKCFHEKKNPHSQSNKFKRLLWAVMCLVRNEWFLLQKSGQSATYFCLCVQITCYATQPKEGESNESSACCVWACRARVLS